MSGRVAGGVFRDQEIRGMKLQFRRLGKYKSGYLLKASRGKPEGLC